MSARETILDALRVPPEPTAPPGSPPRVFRAAPNFLKLRMLQWAGTQLLAIAGLAFAIFFVARISQTDLPRPFIWLLRIGEIFGIIAVAARFVFGWVIVRYDFELRWYMLSDRAIRIREGIMTIREKTIALANIQNISIQQGPLQRLLGIADVEVKTAGGGGGGSAEPHGKGKIGEPMHVAYFRGVDNAEEIRDLVREGVRRQRDTGLGDPDEVHEAPPPDLDDAVAVLLAEARALRQAMSAA
ncbi:MAG TPA: PH domain-containing protein [Thermoanaerobaculia bacterium]|nr:PH domain-containing protein [Thermoanaerobaculia bacterium]